jgi:2,4-dienoyl-CoA reductase-like NADH-dependent reductase (Old Yellow Enzyme family)
LHRTSFDNGPEFQVPFATEIRRELDIPVITVGLIRDAERAEAILQSKQADFIAFGRPLFERPDYVMTFGGNWTSQCCASPCLTMRHPPALCPAYFRVRLNGSSLRQRLTSVQCSRFCNEGRFVAMSLF